MSSNRRSRFGPKQLVERVQILEFAFGVPLARPGVTQSAAEELAVKFLRDSD